MVRTSERVGRRSDLVVLRSECEGCTSDLETLRQGCEGCIWGGNREKELERDTDESASAHGPIARYSMALLASSLEILDATLCTVATFTASYFQIAQKHSFPWVLIQRDYG